MHVQRLTLGGIAGLGFLMLFLPWITLKGKIFGAGKSVSAGIGGYYLWAAWLAAILFLVALLVALFFGPNMKNPLNNLRTPISNIGAYIVAGAAFLAFIFVLVGMLTSGSTTIPFAVMKSLGKRVCKTESGESGWRQECLDAVNSSKKSDYTGSAAEKVDDFTKGSHASSGVGAGAILALILAILLIAAALLFVFLLMKQTQNIVLFNKQGVAGLQGQGQFAGQGGYPSASGFPGQFQPQAGQPGQYQPQPGQFQPQSGQPGQFQPQSGQFQPQPGQPGQFQPQPGQPGQFQPNQQQFPGQPGQGFPQQGQFPPAGNQPNQNPGMGNQGQPNPNQ